MPERHPGRRRLESTGLIRPVGKLRNQTLTPMPNKIRPITLLILDGWGHTECTDHNAIHHAQTPIWDKLWQQYPHTYLSCSGSEVGLPSDQMGNSEVGHLNLGAGRVVYQEFTRISRAIKTGSFFSNSTLTNAVDQAISDGKAIHIMGLLSPGGVHSHEEHIQAFAKLAADRGAKEIYLHAFLDGRDTAPKSAADSITAMENVFAELGSGRIVSVIGRYYAMDRDHRWPRIQAAYDLITQGKGAFHADTAMAALEMAYARNETDEFVQSTSVGDSIKVNDGDTIIFMNYRSDRARQISRAFTDEMFDGFERAYTPKLGTFVSLTEYQKGLSIPVAFPAEKLSNGFGEYISSLGLRQLRIAETEKYAHVTFFFNGGEEHPFDGEDRILVSSPDVATYDLQPEMSAPEVTDKLVEAIESGKYDAIICNFANPDMVGHTGNFDAAVKAIETIDVCLGRIIDALQKVGGEALITADHGNAERMVDPTSGQPHTAHTHNKVPFIYVGRDAAPHCTNCSLADVAPTMLTLMDLPIPPNMTGHAVMQLKD